MATSLQPVDALAIAGNGGTGLESLLAGSSLSGFDDGVVELTNGKLPESTRVQVRVKKGV